MKFFLVIIVLSCSSSFYDKLRDVNKDDSILLNMSVYPNGKNLNPLRYNCKIYKDGTLKLIGYNDKARIDTIYNLSITQINNLVNVFAKADFYNEDFPEGLGIFILDAGYYHIISFNYNNKFKKIEFGPGHTVTNELAFQIKSITKLNSLF